MRFSIFQNQVCGKLFYINIRKRIAIVWIHPFPYVTWVQKSRDTSINRNIIYTKSNMSLPYQYPYTIYRCI